MDRKLVVLVMVLVACASEDPRTASGTETSGLTEPTGSEVTSSSTVGPDTESGSSAPTSSSSEDGSSDSGSSDSGSSSGGSSSSGSDSGETGTTTGVVPDSDADAVDWPEACEGIVAHPVVCLIFAEEGEFGSTVVLAVSPSTGATCEVQSIPVDVYDMPTSMVWIGNRLAYPSTYWYPGGVLDLDTGTNVELELALDNAAFFEWNDGVLFDQNTGGNTVFYDSFDALESDSITETYGLGERFNRGFVLEDVLHTYGYPPSDAIAIDIATATPAEAIVLEWAPEWTNGVAYADDSIFLHHLDTLHTYDLEGALVESQPLALTGHIRGLACSAGVTP